MTIEELHRENAALHARIAELEAKTGTKKLLGEKYMPNDGDRAYFVALEGEVVENDTTTVERCMTFPTHELAEKASPILQKVTDAINILHGTPVVKPEYQEHYSFIYENGGMIVREEKFWNYDIDYDRVRKGNSFLKEQKPAAELVAEIVNDLLALRPNDTEKHV